MTLLLSRIDPGLTLQLAPFSEINGRRPVFITSGIIYVVCVACCAATQTYYGMIFARFFAGCGSSIFSTMVGGVVADIYDREDRNTPMTTFTCGTMFGSGLGPLIGGFITQNVNWRWVFGSHAIVLAVLMAVIIAFFRETRGSVLLSGKAKKLNQWYDACEAAGSPGLVFPSDSNPAASSLKLYRFRWKVKADEERQSLGQMIKISTFRPFHLLFTEPVVFFFSLWVSFCWLVLYLTFSAIPYIFATVYAFDLQRSNAVFASMCVAAVLSTFLNVYQEKAALRLNKLSSTPESRLFFSCIESAFLPIGLFWLGWTAFPMIHWIVPVIAVGAATIGIFSIYLATFNYLADCYGQYASSAIAGQSLCRNLIGGAAPLYTEAMYRRLGIGPASSLLGGIAALLTLVPWVLAFKGPEIRARSKFPCG